jgi:hypothetical protein
MPTRDTAWPAGTPCWTDYAAEDLGAAQAFYAAVVGWSGFTESRPEFGGYTNAKVGERLAAGIMPKMGEDMPAVWTTYFATVDADATVAAIASAGGTVIAGPHEVGDLGRMVVAVDPQGAMFGAWQAGEHLGIEVYNEPGGMVWNEAAMADPDTARHFYTAVFGFRFDPMPELEGYTTFATGEQPLGGLTGAQPGQQTGWQTCFSVASCDAAVDAAESGGGSVVVAAQDQSFGRYAVLADPWGAQFSVMQEPTS